MSSGNDANPDAPPRQGGQNTPHTPPLRPRSRLAPSPTGALHLGNARTFLVNWAIARNCGWELILRIEDLDTPRVKPDAIDQIYRAFEWLGIDWDGEPITQSGDLPEHIGAMDALARAGLVYPCALSRTEIEAAATAPHAGDRERHVGPSLRPADAGSPQQFDPSDTERNWRLIVPDEAVRFHDRFLGACEHNPFESVGDFALWTKRGQASYQLAVTVDDWRQGVTEVVRGSDLADSAARQILVRRALKSAGWSPSAWDGEATYTHLPLVVGSDGVRLAKRHGDTRLDHYRELGVPPETVIGLLGFWCGLVPQREPMDAARFRSLLGTCSGDGRGEPDLSTIPPGNVTLTSEDDRWLRSCARP